MHVPIMLMMNHFPGTVDNQKMINVKEYIYT